VTRSEAEAQFRRYYSTQGKYRQLTRREYRWRTETPELPTDSVRSPVLSGLPLALGSASDPTLRMVMSREEILERRQYALAQLSEEVDRLQDELLQMWELWAILSPVQRYLVELCYWRDLPREDVAQWFVRHEADFEGWRVPLSEYLVRQALEEVLTLAVEQWSVAPPADPAPLR